MKKAVKRHGSPEAIATDGLRSYGAAMKDLGCAERQETARWANNRVENSHLPFRRRERAMPRFRQMKTLQKFASVHATNTSASNATSSIARPTSSSDARPHRPSGGTSQARPPAPKPGRIAGRRVRVRPTAPLSYPGHLGSLTRWINRASHGSLFRGWLGCLVAYSGSGGDRLDLLSGARHRGPVLLRSVGDAFRSDHLDFLDPQEAEDRLKVGR